MKRPFKKWIALILLSLFVLGYMAYFWLFELLRGRALLGGKKHGD